MASMEEDTPDGHLSRGNHAVPIIKLSPGGPIPQNLARALMPRQPYSVAVLSPEGGYIPNPNGRDLGLGYRVRTPSSQEGDRGIETK